MGIATVNEDIKGKIAIYVKFFRNFSTTAGVFTIQFPMTQRKRKREKYVSRQLPIA